ncbi:pilus assembly FimT family protein [Legionella impletisoli]|uniref:Type II secretion system protein H n=1 Tax=Legionella impletisoli TaxID=343510 RepID=A0A917N8K0_9GAMM|nr:GspH/FimT family pseudopilin [Legionella impletisoli]GGI77814.1 hypothetical protein GCM10007966_03080 [Legionella impletisoli]
MLSHRGYSLIELLVALGVFAAILFAAIPSFEGTFKKNNLQIRIDDVKRIIHYARFKALTEGKALRLVPVNHQNWSEGVKLIESGRIDETKAASLHEWRWNSPRITVNWHGFQSNEYLTFSPTVNDQVANGYFEVSNGTQTYKLILNRIARIKVDAILQGKHI